MMPLPLPASPGTAAVPIGMPDLTEAEIEVALRQCYHHPLIVPAVVVEECSLLQIASLMYAGRPWLEMDTYHQQQLVKQCRSWMTGCGWTWHEQLAMPGCPPHTAMYRQWLKPDLEQLEQGLRELLRNGRPIPAADVQQNGLWHAFNARVESDPIGLISTATWSQLLDRFGYETTPRQDGCLHPRPIALPEDAHFLTLKTVRNLNPVLTKEVVPALLFQEVLDKTVEALSLNREPSEMLTAQLLDGPLGNALATLGYERQPTAVWGQDCTPPIETANQAKVQLFVRAMTVGQGIVRIALTQKFAVLCPVLVVDAETLVYLELLGPREAVKANWAALRNAGRRQIINGHLVQVRKADQLTTLKTPLPCGWDHWCVFHRQVSLQKMSPTEPFYLLGDGQDDGQENMPEAFYPLLSRALAAPTLPAWADYLWIHGRHAELITAVNQGGHGIAAWKVDAASPTWGKIISEGIHQAKIIF